MLSSKDKREVITQVKALVLKNHYNIGNVDYKAWSHEVDLQTPALVATDDELFESGVRKLLSNLQSSHTRFLRADAQPTKPQHSIGATIRSVIHEDAARWMFLDVYDKSPAAAAGIRPGDILFAMKEKTIAPPAEPTFRFGEAHELVIGKFGCKGQRQVVVSVPARKASKSRPPLVEPQSVTQEVPIRGVGLLKVPFFSGAFGIRFSKLLDAAVEALKAQGCDRLIVDLRGCLGGSLGFGRLVSYFCSGRIPIGYDITRNRLQRGYDVTLLPRVPMPSTRSGLLLCLLRFSVQDKSLMLLTQGLGDQPFHGRIAVLINEWTNSAGEMAAQFAKDTGTATVVGRRTMGNVLGSTMLTVTNGYRLYLPIFGWYSPNGAYLEGSGVEPDVPTDIEPEDLSRGQDAQLNKALEVVS
jgi:C-terminal processing protease CtpA/Prc